MLNIRTEAVGNSKERTIQCNVAFAESLGHEIKDLEYLLIVGALQQHVC